MALINVGKIDSFAIEAKSAIQKSEPELRSIRSFSRLREIPDSTASGNFELITSEDQRGLGLKEIQLMKGFEGNFQQPFKPTHEVYFIAWTWDLSGQPLFLYPEERMRAEDFIILIKNRDAREFIGQGINLFSKREVKGGMAVRVQLWKSDKKPREVAQKISDIAQKIKESKLNHLLSLVSMSTGITGTTVALIKEASAELSGIIIDTLRGKGDDYVDLFEGYFASDQPWVTGQEMYMGNSTNITFSKY